MPSGLPEKRTAPDYLDLYDVTFRTYDITKPAGTEIRGTSRGCRRALLSKIMKSHENPCFIPG